jgi:hypothetical protein
LKRREICLGPAPDNARQRLGEGRCFEALDAEEFSDRFEKRRARALEDDQLPGLLGSLKLGALML